MAVRLHELVIDCLDTERVARFWSEVLGWPLEPPEEFDGGIVMEAKPPSGDAPSLVFVPVPEPKREKVRLHIDVAAVPPATQAQEVERILALGATHADVGQGEQTWVVLADVEGNEFCVLRRRDEGTPTG